MKVGPNETRIFFLKGSDSLSSLEATVQAPGKKAREGNSAPSTRRVGRGRGREAVPHGRRGPSTDLHSPAGVRPKFGHSLEHIVLQKKPPPPPRKETEAGGVAAPLVGLAPPARASAEGFWLTESDSLAREDTRNRRLLAERGVPEASSPRAGGEPVARGGGDAARRRKERALALRRRRIPARWLGTGRRETLRRGSLQFALTL